MNKEKFVVEELEARFEMEVIHFGSGTLDASASQANETAENVCCQDYTCIGSIGSVGTK